MHSNAEYDLPSFSCAIVHDNDRYLTVPSLFYKFKLRHSKRFKYPLVLKALFRSRFEILEFSIKKRLQARGLPSKVFTKNYSIITRFFIKTVFIPSSVNCGKLVMTHTSLFCEKHTTEFDRSNDDLLCVARDSQREISKSKGCELD